MNTQRLIAAVVLAALPCTLGCSSDDEKPETTTNGRTQPEKPAARSAPEKDSGSDKYTAKERRLARAQFKSYCITCHGKTGKGDGPAGAALEPKPRDWTDQAWHRTVTDQKLFEVIRDGGAKHGLSPSMAPNPQYVDQPGVLWALVDMVRQYRKE